MFDEDQIQSIADERGWRVHPGWGYGVPLVSLMLNTRYVHLQNHTQLNHYPGIKDHHQWFTDQHGRCTGMLVCPYANPIEEADQMAHDWYLKWEVISPSPYANSTNTTCFLFTSAMTDEDKAEFRRLCSPLYELCDPARSSLKQARELEALIKSRSNPHVQ